MVWSLFSLLWDRPRRVLDLWQGAFGMHHNIAFWRLCCIAILCYVVSLAGKKCEMGCEQSILGIKSLFFRTLLDWSVAFKALLCSKLLDMLEHCILKE